MVEAGSYAKKQIFCQNKIIVWSHSSRFQQTRRLLEKYVASKSKLLDYGCGDGTFLTMVSDLFTETVGADIAADQVADCQKRLSSLLPQTSFCVINKLEAEPYNSYFDTVVCMEVIEHCVTQNKEKIIADWKRLVKPNGIIIISVPIEIGPSLIIKQVTRRIAGWLRQGDYDKGTEHYTIGELIKMFFATRSTAIERPIYGNDSIGYHGHKGFNWRSLRHELASQFDIEDTVFSPLGWLGGFVSSQVFLICRNR